MEKFSQLTGVPYDKVMVFPHTTGPETTLAQLKNYGFLATAYSLDLPAGAAVPSNPLFYLRSYNQDFADLLGLNRYYAENPVPSATLAIDAFLGNPIMFYGHESLFNEGSGSFNRLADEVNSLQPDTRWCSLGLYRSTRLSRKDTRRRQCRCGALFQQRGVGKPNFGRQDVLCEKGRDVRASDRATDSRGPAAIVYEVQMLF